MPGDMGELEYDDIHMGLNVIDVIRFLGDLKLEYLDDEISTAIVINYNFSVPEKNYIDRTMSGVEIRECFDALSNADKIIMSKKFLISSDISRDFFTQIIKNSSDQYEFFIKDTEIKGSIVNATSVIIVIACSLIYFIYASTTGLRGSVPESSSGKIVDAVVEYVTTKPGK